ncbi:hypothetical protein BIW11_01114 [Tropilaelaps mercedesae]|uniref:Uncharacterized protein n=1 Tax=Tropilaelaps mercedesae TaxID=418985 RepID=A0A1V9XJB1_9ACAR|nr:hypothetical protein BIW11_01114 [Tropilaelaps mercedesae]
MRRMSFRGGGSASRGSATPESDSHSPHGGSQPTLGPPIDPPPGSEDVILSGYLKKLKTGKRKFFLLRAGSDATQSTDAAVPAGNQLVQQPRLEYFDNEKKWRGGADPKRSTKIDLVNEPNDLDIDGLAFAVPSTQFDGR